MVLSDIGIIRMITWIYSSLTQYINTCDYIYIHICGYIPRRDIVQLPTTLRTSWDSH